MHWSLIEEIGIEYAAPEAARPGEKLQLPATAAKASDGSYMIVDELDYALPKGEHTQCRTIRVSSDGRVLYDSRSNGINDGYGALLKDGNMAILSRAAWEILIVTVTGEILDRLPVWAFSKRYPRYLYATATGTLLVSFLDNIRQYDVVELDCRGRMLWYLPNSIPELGFPVGLEITSSDHVQITDILTHAVIETDRCGAVIWQWGEWNSPADSDRQLSMPTSIRALPDGGRLVADSRNHRILMLDKDGNGTTLVPAGESFCDPTYADQTADGHYLVCDSGNHRVVELDSNGDLVWQYGGHFRQRRDFSYPRSVEAGMNGDLIVADTAHNTVQKIIGDGRVVAWPLQDDVSLFWPRCARCLPSGSILIADGRHSRIIEVSAEGELLRQLDTVRLNGNLSLSDPHDATQLANGHLLIADSSLDLVFEADWSGHVYRTVGYDDDITLSDPHSAVLLGDDRILISDPGNHRVLITGDSEHETIVFTEFRNDAIRYRLRAPRHAVIGANDLLIVVDTGNNRVLASDLDGNLAWELSHIPDSPIAMLRYPRWVYPLTDDELLVSDLFNHRVVRLRLNTSC